MTGKLLHASGPQLKALTELKVVGNQAVLQLYHSMLSILHYFHLGNTVLAGDLLTSCHSLLEQEEFDGDIRISFELLPGASFCFNLFTKAEAFSLIYLLSGIVMSSEPSMKSSKRFLLEGIEYVNGSLNQVHLQPLFV